MTDKYDPSKRVVDCPYDDACHITQIQVSFAIPIHLTQEHQGRLLDLVEEITRQPWNQPQEGVHWLCHVGGDPSTLGVATTAREFLDEREKVRELRRRARKDRADRALYQALKKRYEEDPDVL